MADYFSRNDTAQETTLSSISAEAADEETNRHVETIPYPLDNRRLLELTQEDIYKSRTLHELVMQTEAFDQDEYDDNHLKGWIASCEHEKEEARQRWENQEPSGTRKHAKPYTLDEQYYEIASIYEELKTVEDIDQFCKDIDRFDGCTACGPFLSAIGDVTPEQAIQEVPNAKTGHRGVTQTWVEVNKRYPFMKVPLAMVRNYVQDCPACAKIQIVPRNQMTMQRSLPVYHARAVTHVDLLTLDLDDYGNKYAYVFVNAFTKYTQIRPSKDKTPFHAAIALLEYASIVGITEIIWSDNGPEFCDAIVQELTKILGSTWQYTLTYRPQANGIVERQNGEILKIVRTILLFEQHWTKWSQPQVIALTQLALNTRVHGSTGYTPVELTFGTAARQYFKDPEKLNRAEHEDLHEFNQALANIHDAAKLNLLASQLPRLKNQPETIVTYSPGDLVLRDPITETGAIRLRERKLMPAFEGPYEVIEQRSSGTDLSNTVRVREVNNIAKEHDFHHSTLKIFPGTYEDAQKLQQLDALESRIARIMSIQGNTQNRDDIQAAVLFEDNTITELPYAVVYTTEAWKNFCATYIYGKSLYLTRAEEIAFTNENSPIATQTLQNKWIELFPNNPIRTRDRRYITAHFWNSRTWHVRQQLDTLPAEIRNREPVFLAIIEKFTLKRVDLDVPVLGKRVGLRDKSYRISMTLPQLLLYTINVEDLSPAQLEITHALAANCSLREQLHAAARF